jgi:hypothetical protein
LDSTGSARTDAVIELRLRTTAEGGRQGPVFGKDYRPQFHVPSEPQGDLGCLIYPGGQTLELGVTYTVPLNFIFPDLARARRIALGDRFMIREGHRVVADGAILELNL